MLCSYEKMTGVTYKGFRNADRAISALHKELHTIAKVVGNLPSLFTSRTRRDKRCSQNSASAKRFAVNG